MQRTLLVIFTFTAVVPALAQKPHPERIPQMQQIASALGVNCKYCHSAPRNSGIPEPKKEIARAMMDMTDELNARIRTATAKEPGQVTDVQCAFCHRGVPIPKPIGDIVWQAIREKGPSVAADQYRELRKQFYGRSTYDFGEEALATLGERVANVRPDDAIAILNLNLDYYPKSVSSLMALSFAQTRKLDDIGAMATLERALEIEPENGSIRGRLEQLKSYHRPR